MSVVDESIRNFLTLSTDYCIAAFAVIIIVSVFQWIVDGRKNYTGPRIDMTIDALETMPAVPEPRGHKK